MSCLCFDAMTLWMLGYPDQAEKKAQEAIILARDLRDIHSPGRCLSMIAMYYSMRREYAAASVVIKEGLSSPKNTDLRSLKSR